VTSFELLWNLEILGGSLPSMRWDVNQARAAEIIGLLQGRGSMCFAWPT